MKKMENAETTHERFGELSALAILGQVSPEEYQELKTHLENCAACREEHDALAQILLAELPLAHAEKEPELEPVVAAQGAEANFLSRVSKESGTSVPEMEEATGVSTWWKRFTGLLPQPAYGYAAVFLLLAAAGALSLRVWKDSRLDAERFGQIAELNNEMAQLRDKVRDLSSQKRKTPTDVPRATEPQAPVYSGLQARNQELETQLKTAEQQISALKEQASSSVEQEKQLTARLSDTQTLLDQLSAESKTLRDSHAQDTGTITKQKEEMHELEARFATASDSMERDRRLLTADRDIRDLMGARNLRIVDVYDVDGKGKTRKPFGRVFFTEGKSLIFYAFDLGDERPSVQSAAYQAWGSEGTFQRGVRSLGIFYRDDQKANRWVLKFDDPNVLAEIDSVFVTIEPPGGSKKPTGGRLLAAYVKANLNHP